jgi:daunorubicin resistance ABC transporter ATP-binding subunit
VSAAPVIEARGIVKRFGELTALGGVDLTVEQGTVVGLLGPNGAGKTTLVRVLTTLLDADGGHATVAGHDVATDKQAVRRSIGLAGQFAAVDALLTGRENIELVGRLYGLSRQEAAKRAGDLLERLSLTDAADRLVRTYSGGMRRRLDLGASLVGEPRVLVLDEPTTGLDPRTRIELWEIVEGLVADGTTVLLTTQYLEEADRLASRIVLIDTGLVIAEGTPDELKERLGANLIDARLRDAAQGDAAIAALASLPGEAPQWRPAERLLRIPTATGSGTLLEALRLLDAAGIQLEDVSLHRPSLEDVFLTLTGRRPGGDDA